MKRLVIIILLLIPFLEIKAQNTIPKHAIKLELGGKGLIYNLSYEYNVATNFILSGGVSFLNLKEKQTEKSMIVMSFPLSVSYLLYFKNPAHNIEFGVGTMNLLTSGDLVEYKSVTDLYINPLVIVGYRFYPVEKNWFLNVAFTPFYGTKSIINEEGYPFNILGSRFQMWGSIGIGYKL